MYPETNRYVLQGVWGQNDLNLTEINKQVRLDLMAVSESWDMVKFGSYNHFSLNAYCAPSIGPDVNKPQ